MISENEIRAIVSKTLQGLMTNQESTQARFDDMNVCVEAAHAAFEKFVRLSLDERRQIVEAMRACARENAEAFARAAYDETGYGSVEHKIQKCLLAANRTPGVEDIEQRVLMGDKGLMLTVPAPYGVIGSITPSTNPAATVINNAISMTSGGNTVVFGPHPGAKKCTQLAIDKLNQAVLDAGCPAPLLFMVNEPSVESSGQLMNHPLVKLLSVTGGEGIVKIAMKTGKKVIGAGPGNPPVIVDETANIEKAGRDIVDGASFENNIQCIAEKEIFVVERVGRRLLTALCEAGAQLIDPEEAERLLKTVLICKDGKYVINRKYVGKPAAFLLKEADVPLRDGKIPRLIVTVTRHDHPFVMTEMLMPIVPVVYAADVNEAIHLAVIAEKGCHHSAMMHSTNVENLTRAARALDTTIFVKNGPSYAGIGFGGEGHTTFTIATPTGEGVTSARSFTRARRCVLCDSFQIV